MTMQISRFGSQFGGVAAAFARRSGNGLMELARRWWQRRVKLRELEDLLTVDERVLRDVGLTRLDVSVAIERLRGASLWTKDPVPERWLTSTARPSARRREG